MKNRRIYNTPILFLIFNRPEITKKVFKQIKKTRPAYLYVAADGPRRNRTGEKERCEAARRVTENIDWQCEVKRLYRRRNLGCKLAVSGAINWFFKNVEEGIILEDDCLPNSSFFNYCRKMLELYRDDRKVMCISGDNFLPKDRQRRSDYYFSKYIHIWGWATWKRAWNNYDAGMKDWPEVKREETLDKYFDNFIEKVYWTVLFDAVYSNKIDTWDYQFVYHIWKNNGVSIMPNTNLISNIGFSADALHTKSNQSSLSEIDTNAIGMSFKKKKIILDAVADSYSSRYIFKINLLNVLKQKLYYSLRSK